MLLLSPHQAENIKEKLEDAAVSFAEFLEDSLGCNCVRLEATFPRWARLAADMSVGVRAHWDVEAPLDECR